MSLTYVLESVLVLLVLGAAVWTIAARSASCCSRWCGCSSPRWTWP